MAAKSALPLLALGAGALLLMGRKKKPSKKDESQSEEGLEPPKKVNGVDTPAAREAKEIWSDRQVALAFLGYDAGEYDGEPTEATRIAIKEFQGDHGIPQTGEWNQETAEAMKKAGLTKLKDMAWEQIRSLWSKYFPQWSDDPKDETIEFDKIFESLTEINPFSD